MTIVRWEPLRELSTLSPRSPPVRRARWNPAMDLVERGDEYVLRADLPGVSQEDVRIEIVDELLTISGERKSDHHESTDRFIRLERAFGAFSRSADPAEGRRRRDRHRAVRRRRPELRVPKPERSSRAASRSSVGDRAVPPSSRTSSVERTPTLRAWRSRSTRAAARRAPGRCDSPTARSARRPSCRWRPRASSATLEPRDVRALGFDMVLGQHVPPVPHARATSASRDFGGLHEFMRWDAADHHGLRRLPGLLDGPRQRRRRDQGPRVRAAPTAQGKILAHRGGGRALPLLPRRLASSSWAPRPRWRSRPRSGSDIALVFDECTPFHVTRDYTARSTERTHRWLDRCLDVARRARAGRPGRLRHRPGRRRTRTCGARRRRRSPRARTGGIAIGGSLGADKPQMYEVVELGDRRAARGAAAPPARASATSTT